LKLYIVLKLSSSDIMLLLVNERYIGCKTGRLKCNTTLALVSYFIIITEY